MFDPGPLTAKLTAKRLADLHSEHGIHAIRGFTRQRSSALTNVAFGRMLRALTGGDDAPTLFGRPRCPNRRAGQWRTRPVAQ